jgi:hypothetical protein
MADDAHDITLDRRGGLKALGAHVGQLIGPLARRRGTATARLAAEWPTIVGAEIARQSFPERLAGGSGRVAPGNVRMRQKTSGGGTLRLRVDGPLALELQHMAPQLMERINGYFGYTAVSRLQIVQGPLPFRPPVARPVPRLLDRSRSRALQEKVAPIGDSALRQALERLGKAILAGK